MIKDKIIDMNNDTNTFDTFVLKEGESKETIYTTYDKIITFLNLELIAFFYLNSF